PAGAQSRQASRRHHCAGRHRAGAMRQRHGHGIEWNFAARRAACTALVARIWRSHQAETNTSTSSRTNETNAGARRQRHSPQASNSDPRCGRNYFWVPDPALSMVEGLLLDELPAFFLPVAIPVVVPFFMLVCLVALLVAPAPTFPSLDAPGAGCICANAPPVDSNRAHAQARMVFFMGNSF